MNHDFYSPMWTQYRGQFAENLGAIARTIFGVIDHAFGRLHSYQFGAPWHRHACETRYSSFR